MNSKIDRLHANQDGLSEPMECPFCGGGCLHPVGVLVFPIHGNALCAIDKFGIVVSPSGDAGKGDRGISIVTMFFCELCLMMYEETRRFHKGSTYCRYDIKRECEDGDGFDQPNTIWRD